MTVLVVSVLCFPRAVCGYERDRWATPSFTAPRQRFSKSLWIARDSRWHGVV